MHTCQIIQAVLSFMMKFLNCYRIFCLTFFLIYGIITLTPHFIRRLIHLSHQVSLQEILKHIKQQRVDIFINVFHQTRVYKRGNYLGFFVSTPSKLLLTLL